MKISKDIKYLQVSKVAKMLDCSTDFVHQLIRDGELTAINLKTKATRVLVESLMEFIDKSQVNPEEYYK